MKRNEIASAIEFPEFLLLNSNKLIGIFELIHCFLKENFKKEMNKIKTLIARTSQLMF